LRGFAVIGFVALWCCGPAAATPPPSGDPVLPGPLPSPRALQSLDAYPQTLVELDRVKGPALESRIRHAGGELISPRLELWRLPSAQARRVLPRLLQARVVRSVTPDRPLEANLWSVLGLFAPLAEPLASTEWWRPRIGADRWQPPGPGVPLTVIDSGLDVSHEEFRRRPNTTTLNKQILTDDESELHGTAVSSVAAAPANGVGLVGVYPRARLRSFDISPQGLPTIADELLALAAVSARGRGVVNISFGGATYFPIEKHGILSAFDSGSLMVAAAGNFRELLSPIEYPANFAHVLTVGATDQADSVTVFSSATPALDLAAPGEEIPVATPRVFYPEGYITAAGTSFSAPMVAGAAAAIWTRRPKLDKTQLFEVLRASARDVGDAGRDADTGFGILNIPRALRLAPPRVDPQEPNEDVYLVKPNGISRSGHHPLTGPARPRAGLRARLDAAEDPVDVYRGWLPAGRRLVATVATSADVRVEAWGPGTATVYSTGRAQRRNLLGSSFVAGGSTGTLSIRGRTPGRYVYVDVFLEQEIVTGSYSLRLSTAPQ
jgi:subtilase family protein